MPDPSPPDEGLPLGGYAPEPPARLPFGPFNARIHWEMVPNEVQNQVWREYLDDSARCTHEFLTCQAACPRTTPAAFGACSAECLRMSIDCRAAAVAALNARREELAYEAWSSATADVLADETPPIALTAPPGREPDPWPALAESLLEELGGGPGIVASAAPNLGPPVTSVRRPRLTLVSSQPAPRPLDWRFLPYARGFATAIDLWNYFEEDLDEWQQMIERRRQIAEDLLAQGLISEEEADEYIRTGKLFLPKDPAKARDVYRAIWFQLGREFEAYVHKLLFEQHVRDGRVVYQELLSTTLGMVRPDWLVLAPDGPDLYRYVVECKEGEIDRDQARKLIEVAANLTTERMIVYVVPSEGSRIPPGLKEEASRMKVRIKRSVVPWIPEWWPTTLPPPD